MPIWNIFLCDLTGDGLPEICATVSFGSGIIDDHIIVYDYEADKIYELSDRMIYDYSLLLEDQKLVAARKPYNGSNGGSVLYGSLVIQDGRLVMSDSREALQAYPMEDVPRVERLEIFVWMEGDTPVYSLYDDKGLLPIEVDDIRGNPRLYHGVREVNDVIMAYEPSPVVVVVHFSDKDFTRDILYESTDVFPALTTHWDPVDFEYVVSQHAQNAGQWITMPEPEITQIVRLDDRGFTVPLSALNKYGFYLDIGLIELSIHGEPPVDVEMTLNRLDRGGNQVGGRFRTKFGETKVVYSSLMFDYGAHNEYYFEGWTEGDPEYDYDPLVTVRLSQELPDLSGWPDIAVIKYALHSDGACSEGAQEELARRFEDHPEHLLENALESGGTTDTYFDVARFVRCLAGYYLSVIDDVPRFILILDNLDLSLLELRISPEYVSSVGYEDLITAMRYYVSR
jgi:hypothetical protein